MIHLKDLQNRVYSGRECVRFDVTAPVGDDETILVQFEYIHGKGTVSKWRARLILDRTAVKDSEVYAFEYVMPKANMPLEMVAATGLRYLNLYIAEEVQKKSNINFAIGDIISGM